MPNYLGFPGGVSGKELACQCRRHKRLGSHPWVGKIPWRRAWQPNPVFFFFSTIFSILFFHFTILYWFCHISTWICHRYTRVPHPEPSSFLPPHTIPLSRPVHQPQATSIVHQTWTGDSFHIWYYSCFNAILPNHPTLSLSHRVQKTVLYISVSLKIFLSGLPLLSMK